MENLPLIEQILAFVCRKCRFSREDCDDFKQSVQVKLIENDYRVLRECTGSSLRSYLKVVILRASQDFRNRLWGKYRDTAEAQRLGEAGKRLERLITRDGLSHEEARRYLQINEKIELTDEEFEKIIARLPPRQRRHWFPVESLNAVADSARDPDEALRAKEATRRQAEILDLLDRRARELSTEHQLLLRMIYQEGLTIAEIARARKVPQKPLYTERDRALRQLRELLEKEGVRKDELEAIFRLLLDATGPDEADEE